MSTLMQTCYDPVLQNHFAKENRTLCSRELFNRGFFLSIPEALSFTKTHTFLLNFQFPARLLLVSLPHRIKSETCSFTKLKFFAVAFRPNFCSEQTDSQRILFEQREWILIPNRCKILNGVKATKFVKNRAIAKFVDLVLRDRKSFYFKILSGILPTT